MMAFVEVLLSCTAGLLLPTRGLSFVDTSNAPKTLYFKTALGTMPNTVSLLTYYLVGCDAVFVCSGEDAQRELVASCCCK